MGRCFLMAVGTGTYELVPDSLPAVGDDVRLVVDLFTRQLGYERVPLQDGRADLDLTVAELKRGLSRWLRAQDRRPDDLVVFYYCGHGGVEARRHYLLAADSDPDDLVSSAFPCAELGVMFSRSVVTGMLIILDTCYSGWGTADIGVVAADLDKARPAGERPGAGLWLIASSGPKGEADQSAFAKTFVRCVGDSRAGQRERYLSPLDIVGAVNDAFKDEQARQWAEVRMGSAGGMPPFLPNVRYRPNLPEGIDLDVQRALRAEDLVVHWGPRARGVEVDAQPGWHFSGRIRVLSELVGWLTGPAGDRRPRVVTGGPGSGKSAVLARLVTLSDPEIRDHLPLVGVPPETVPPAGLIDVAVHARGKSIEEVTAEISAASGARTTSPTILIDRLGRRPSRLVLVIDAVDEASRPRELAAGLLCPLAGLAASGAADLRLVVGTRWELVDALGATAVIDLDAADYLDVADLTDYVARLLAGDAPEPSPEARHLATAVAARAYPTFLVARLIARSLITSDLAADATEELPTTIDAALDRDFRRFGADRPRVRELLRPLAYAEGAGLPRRLWPAIATALASTPYTDGDLAWLLTQAGSYLVEALDEQERTVYRLYHRAFADVLARPGSQQAAQHTIAGCLAEQAASGGYEQWRWRDADPYIRTHLVAHAAAAGTLDDLMGEPEFLIAADPTRLMAALTSLGSPRARRLGGVYRRAAHLLRTGSEARRAAYLELVARQSDEDELADALAAVDIPRSWRVRWARWRSSQPYQVLGWHSGAVLAVALGQVGDRTIIISGGDDRKVRRWDPVTGDPLKVLKDHQEAVTSLLVRQVGDRSMLSSTDRRRTFHWDLATGVRVEETNAVEDPAPSLPRLISVAGRRWQVSCTDTIYLKDDVSGESEWLEGHSGAVRAVAAGSVDGRPVLVSGGEDGTVRLWELRSGGSSTDRAVYARAVGITRVAGRMMLVTADHDTLQRWDAVTGEEIGRPLEHPDGIDALTVGLQMAVFGGADGTIRRWDLSTGQPAGPPLRGHGHVRALALAEVDGRAVIISGGEDCTVRRWDARGYPIGERLLGHDFPIYGVALVDRPGRSMIVSVDSFRQVMRWDWATGEPLAPLRLRLPINLIPLVVAIGDREGAPTILASGGGERRILRWDLISGEQQAVLGGHRQAVTCLATGLLPGHEIAVSGDRAGVVHVWDLKTAQLIETIDAGAEIRAVATQETMLAVVTTRGMLLIDLNP